MYAYEYTSHKFRLLLIVYMIISYIRPSKQEKTAVFNEIESNPLALSQNQQFIKEVVG